MNSEEKGKRDLRGGARTRFVKPQEKICDAFPSHFLRRRPERGRKD